MGEAPPLSPSRNILFTLLPKWQLRSKHGFILPWKYNIIPWSYKVTGNQIWCLQLILELFYERSEKEAVSLFTSRSTFFIAFLK